MSVGRQVMNIIYLLGFALERDDWDKVEIYKEKMCQFEEIFPSYIVDTFNCLQYAAPRKYYDLMIELLERMDVTMQASNNVAHDALESVTIFLVCVGIYRLVKQFLSNIISTNIFAIKCLLLYVCSNTLILSLVNYIYF